MLKFINKTKTLSILFGSAALIAVISATSGTPAFAQGIPAGLLRLDPPQVSNGGVKLTEDQQAKARGAFAQSWKNKTKQQ